MSRIKTFDATGVAPNGRLYAGDLNLLQDQYADLSNFAQTLDVGTLRVGDGSLQILKYGAGEFRLSGAVRTDGILRALGGLYAGAFTTTQRDAIGVGLAPYGLAILNTTTNQYEWNKGTDVSRSWVPLGVDPASDLVFSGVGSSIDFISQVAGNYFITAKRAADTVPRFAIKEDGQIEWGDGALTRDTFLARGAAGRLDITNTLRLLGNLLEIGTGGQLTDSLLKFGGSPSMYVVRSNQGQKRRIETGIITITYLGFSTSAGGSAVFSTPFALAPNVIFSIAGNPNSGAIAVGISALSPTGFSLNSYSAGSPGFSMPYYYIAEGPA